MSRHGKRHRRRGKKQFDVAPTPVTPVMPAAGSSASAPSAPSAASAPSNDA